MTFENFLNAQATILRKGVSFEGGISQEGEILISKDACRITSPTARDLVLVQHQHHNKQLWKIYLNADSQFEDHDILVIDNIRYLPLVRYEVNGRQNQHHIKIIATRVE